MNINVWSYRALRALGFVGLVVDASIRRARQCLRGRA